MFCSEPQFSLLDRRLPPACPRRFRPWEMRPGQYVAAKGPDGRLTYPKPDPQQEECMALPLR